MITKDKKKEIVESLVEDLKGVAGLYVLDFSRLTVANTIELRRAFKAKGVKFKVAKNTLIRIALNQVGGFDIDDKYLKEQSGLILGYDDPTVPAKILKEFLDKNKSEIPKLKAAIIDGQFFDGSKLSVLATLPSKTDMYAAILGSLDAPVSGIVGSINAVIRDIASMIEEVAKKKAA
jgi:large subunit ribosomal protein L10